MRSSNRLKLLIFLLEIKKIIWLSRQPVCSSSAQYGGRKNIYVNLNATAKQIVYKRLHVFLVMITRQSQRIAPDDANTLHWLSILGLVKNEHNNLSRAQEANMLDAIVRPKAMGTERDFRHFR